jgi:transcriptional regulator with XRE-family HTH domain
MEGRRCPLKQQPVPGLTIRKLRQERGWTLAEASKRSNLPISTLSKIENGKATLTLEKLVRMSQAFGMDVAQLFQPTASGSPACAAGGRRSIARAEAGEIRVTKDGAHRCVAADLLNKRFVPVIGELRAQSLEEFGGLRRSAGEGFLYVLEGALDFLSEIYSPTRLNEGDSIYFDCGMAHAYIAVQPEPCKILQVFTLSEPELRELFAEIASAPKRPTRTRRTS